MGVIGAGAMGERHCRVCANLRGTELVGLADPNETRGRQVAGDYETAYYPDHRAMLSELDAVTIAAPTAAHYALARECLERGLHVLVEKPITHSISSAQQLVREAKERGLVLQVGHIERFNPAFIELNRVTDMLSVIGVTIRRLSPFDTSNTDVDVIRDLMIHDLDLAVKLIGKPVRAAHAAGRSVKSYDIDHAMADLSFADGPIVTLFASRVTEHKIRAIEVVADGAYIEADLLGKSVMVHRRTFPQYLNNHSTTRYRQESVIERIHVPMSEPLMLELRHFTDCVREGRPTEVPGTDGLRALELAEEVASQIERKDHSALEPQLAVVAESN